MINYKILIPGYARQDADIWHASSTVILIEDNNKKIIVDPGCNKTKLLRALKKVKITPQKITDVFLTHHHLDHTLNASLFTNARIHLDNEYFIKDKIIPEKKYISGTKIEIIPTPGHRDDHCSLAFQSDNKTIVIAGDVFWWADDEPQKTDQKSLLNRYDEVADNKTKLLASRKKLLTVADVIIPGHGKIFYV